MSFEIAWSPRARKSLQRLPQKVSTAAVEFICGPLAENPHGVGKPLRLELEGVYSARRGDYRVLYVIEKVVTILRIDHRSDVYGR